MTHISAIAVPTRMAPKVSSMPGMWVGRPELDSWEVGFDIFTVILWPVKTCRLGGGGASNSVRGYFDAYTKCAMATERSVGYNVLRKEDTVQCQDPNYRNQIGMMKIGVLMRLHEA